MNAPEEGDDRAVPASQDSSPRIRFCRKCGALLDAVTGECVTCLVPSSSPSLPRSEPAVRGTAVWSALSLYFALLATSLLAYAAIPDEVQMELVTEAVDSVLVFAWAAAAWPSVSRGLKTLPSGRSLLLAMGLGGLSFALASAAVHFLTNALGIESIRYVEPLQDAGFGFAVVLLVICIQPAVIEELAFRGVILESLESILDPREAIIVSALLFMVLHLAVPSFPHLFIMGLLLGVLRRRTGSLYPCMALHFTHNSLCVLTEALGWW